MTDSEKTIHQLIW